MGAGVTDPRQSPPEMSAYCDQNDVSPGKAFLTGAAASPGSLLQ